MSERRTDAGGIILVAGWSRVVLGLAAAALLPVVYPGLASDRWIFLAYVVLALAGQALIWKRIGGKPRAIVGGAIDMVLITYLIHRVGSQGTMLVSVYSFAVIVNALVVGPRMGIGLATFAAFAYCGVVVAEGGDVLPYAPAAQGWTQMPPPPLEGLLAVGLNAMLLIASAAVVGLLVAKIRRRETKLRALADSLEALSQRDPLTQLFNRRHLMARLDAELARVRRGQQLAVIMIDLDRFKRVNDESGHHKGDEVLVAIAGALVETTREVDVPARYGGDEFVVLLPDTPPASAAQVAQRLVDAVRRVGEGFDSERPVTASLGLAFAGDRDDANGLMRRADRQAYRAKQEGGDCVCANRDAHAG